MNRITKLLLFACVFQTANYAGATANGVFAEGRAFEPGTGTFLYREQHIQLAEGQQVVLYRDSEDKLFAKKILDFVHAKTAPDVIQEDTRSGEFIQIVRLEEGKQLRIDYRDSKTADTKTAETSSQPTLVVDAGFDHFVRGNWTDLKKGNAASLEYLLPSRQQTVALTIRQSNCPEATNNSTCFTVTPTNWFFRMLAPSIYLAYDNETRCLTHFRGKSNISSEQGAAMAVDIYYTHHQSCSTAE